MKKHRLCKGRVVADLISSTPHGLPISKQPPEPARACGGRPRQTERRPEVFVVRFNFVPHPELRWIESRKGRIRQHIRGLSECLVAQAHCQRQGWHHLPIILEEVGLPKLTGLETLQILRSFNHELPVILITGDSSAGLIRQAFQAQAYSVIPKPVSKNVLLHTLFRALGRAGGDRAQKN